MSYILEDVYINVYGFRDDPLEDLDLPREKKPWLPALFVAVDLFTVNQRRVSHDSILDYPNCRMAAFMVYLCGFMSNESDKQQTIKWLRAVYNLLEVPSSVQRYWMNNLTFEVPEESKDHQRIFRKAEDYSNIYLRLLSGAFNTVRSLDLTEVV